MCEYWTISQRSLTFHWKLYWQLHMHVMWQIKKQSTLLEQWYVMKHSAQTIKYDLTNQLITSCSWQFTWKWMKRVMIKGICSKSNILNRKQSNLRVIRSVLHFFFLIKVMSLEKEGNEKWMCGYNCVKI